MQVDSIVIHLFFLLFISSMQKGCTAIGYLCTMFNI